MGEKKNKKPVTIGVIGNVNGGRKSLIDAMIHTIEENSDIYNIALNEECAEKNKVKKDIIIDLSKQGKGIEQ